MIFQLIASQGDNVQHCKNKTIADHRDSSLIWPIYMKGALTMLFRLILSPILCHDCFYLGRGACRNQAASAGCRDMSVKLFQLSGSCEERGRVAASKKNVVFTFCQQLWVMSSLAHLFLFSSDQTKLKGESSHAIFFLEHLS